MRSCLLTLLLFATLQSTSLGQQIGEVGLSPGLIFSVVLAFLTGQCRDIYMEGGRLPGLPPRDDYVNYKFDPANIANEMPISTTGPRTLRGLFFADIPNDVAEVISMAETNEGGGLGGPFQGSPPTRRMRIMSQRNWAADAQVESTGSLERIAGARDFHIIWRITEGTIDAPTKMDVVVDLFFNIFCLRASGENCPAEVTSGYAGGTMRLKNDMDHPTFTGSVVWERSLVDGGEEILYEAIQIVDEFGNILQPAFSAFLAKIGNGMMITKELNGSPGSPQCSSPPSCFLPFLC